MDDLKIQQKIYDMIKYSNGRIINFPKSERFALGAEIKQAVYQMLRLVIVANKHRGSKIKYLDEIDVELDVVRTFVRLAADKDLRYIDPHQYEVWSRHLNEIGRMLGAWKKVQ